MVKYKTILKAIEQETHKTHYTLKAIRKQIEPTIKKITDNQEEYDILMKEIPNFYRRYWNEKKENLSIIDNNKQKIDPILGEDHCVTFTDDIVEQAEKEGLFLTIHNHPSATSIQSDGDYYCIASLGIKYGVSISKDGIVISKNTYGKASEDYADDVLSSWSKWHTNLKNEVRKTKESQEIDEWWSQIPFNEMFGERSTEISQELHERERKMYKNYVLNNMDEQIDNLNKQYETDDIPIRMSYIEIAQP